MGQIDGSARASHLEDAPGNECDFVLLERGSKHCASEASNCRKMANSPSDRRPIQGSIREPSVTLSNNKYSLPNPDTELLAEACKHGEDVVVTARLKDGDLFADIGPFLTQSSTTDRRHSNISVVSFGKIDDFDGHLEVIA